MESVETAVGFFAPVECVHWRQMEITDLGPACHNFAVSSISFLEKRRAKTMRTGGYSEYHGIMVLLLIEANRVLFQFLVKRYENYLHECCTCCFMSCSFSYRFWLQSSSTYICISVIARTRALVSRDFASLLFGRGLE
jgi:hypothetical protein